jgi:alkylation response protein AidB-like acyl-CoA dehydrogenase
MVAPVIMAFGSDEQKKKYLPPILRQTSGGARGILSRALGPISPLFR